MMRPLLVVAWLVAAWLAIGTAAVAAQELEPRAYSPTPVGLNFVAAAGSLTSGGVLLDPALPLDNVSAEISAASLGYARTLDVWGRSANFGIGAPYVWGTAEGDVGEDRRSIDRSGLGDLRLRFTINLLGAPAMSREAFAQHKPATTLGASLHIVAPTGQYTSERLINIGSNRWSFKPEIGLSHPRGPWTLEASVGAWFFMDNDDFYQGVTREQEPLLTTQFHIGYTFRPQLWIALNSTFYTGGRTIIAGDRKSDFQENTRIGLTLSLPLARGHSLKLAYSDGASTRIGGSFETWAASYQFAW